MALQFTQAQYDELNAIAETMTKTDARELPIHDSVCERLAKLAGSLGFVSEAAVMEALRDRPVSAFIQALAYVGAP